MRYLKAYIFGLLVALTSCGQIDDNGINTQVTNSAVIQTGQKIQIEKFKVGQVWKYNNRVGEDSSKVTILKIEKYEKGDTIIHIRVDGVNIYSPQSSNGYSHFVGHLPFSLTSISKSVIELVGQNNNVPDFSDGYNQWKEAWDTGKGGCWTVDLKEAIDAIDKGMREKK